MHRIIRQIGLLFMKNLKLILRHWLWALFQLMVPLVLFGLIGVLYMYNIEKQTPIDSVTIDKPDDLEIPMSIGLQLHLYYTPHNKFTSDLIEKVDLKVGSGDFFTRPKPQHFLSEQDMEDNFNAKSTNSTKTEYKFVEIYTVGVVFLNLKGDDIPKNLEYKIRISNDKWITNILSPAFQPSEPMKSNDIYFQTGFLSFQRIIDSIFIQLSNPKSSVIDPIKYTAQKFPFPPHVKHMRVLSILTTVRIISVSVVFAFVLMYLNISGRIVEDKHTGVTELMKLMGLNRAVLWLTWLLRCLVDNVLILAVIALFLLLPLTSYPGAIIKYVDVPLLIMFLLLYSIASVFFLFTITTIFSRPVIAMVMSALIFMMSHFIPVFVIQSLPQTKLFVKVLVCLLPNTAMDFGFLSILNFEGTQIGLGWHNINKVSVLGSENELKMLTVMLMLLLDIFVYGFLTWYLDAIMPGKYGVPEPWYFLCTKTYWRINQVDQIAPSSSTGSLDAKSVEPPPKGLKVGIKVQDLRKKYWSGKVAIDGVSLDIYDSQITALLGHNGAGKTTLMSVITGMIPPSSGNIFVNNYNIRTDLNKVRESLGLCPQHNMLFTNLTVMEHLVFFGRLKGMRKKDAKAEANDLLKKMQLASKANEKSSTLSGGMKRKLSLGISLIGGSKVVILDEPTSGLDPQSRRQIWNMLLAMRGERTILITTHFMEEADILGDRIAIMDHGLLQCYGTPMYLKRQYGAGYMLKLLIVDGCDVANLTRTVQRSVSGAKLIGRLGAELRYSLPVEAKSRYSELFGVIERDKPGLGIASIGLSLSTLEDVFLRVGHEDESAQKQKSNVDPKKSKDEFKDHKPNMSGISLLIQQFYGLFVKKIIYTRRSCLSFLILATLTILLALGAVLLGLQTLNPNTSYPATRLSLKDYGSSKVLYSDVKSPVAKWYNDIITSEGSVPSAMHESMGNNISTALVEEGRKNVAKYREKFVVAAQFSSENGKGITVNAMFSDSAYHSAAVSISLINNALLKSQMDSNEYSITTINHPFPVDFNAQRVLLPTIVMSLWAVFMSLSMLFIIGFYLIFPLQERSSNAKQLQYMAGVNPITYWFSCFLCDFLMYAIMSAVVVSMLPICDVHKQYGTENEIGIFVLILFLFGLSALPHSYWYSYFSDSTAFGVGIHFGVNLFAGTILPFIVFMTQMLLENMYPEHMIIMNIIEWFFFLSPHYCVTSSVMHFAAQAVTNNDCTSMTKAYKEALCKAYAYDPCCLGKKSLPYLDFRSKTNVNAIGKPVLMLGVNAVLYWVLIMLLDFGVISWIFSKLQPAPFETEMNYVEEEDVKAEAIRARTKDVNVLTVTDLSKAYSRKNVAVKNVTFGVLPSECFGLLGVNGAGKTTTFKMLTGAELPTTGDARIDSYSILKNRSQYMSQIGYCPQFDGFNESLTGKEMLTVFARLRGIHRDHVKTDVANWLKQMDLEEHQNNLSSNYSGGNKRKLTTALALIGNPPLIFLDEPTSGVDPVARRNLWGILSDVQKSNRSIVLTSHSMDECEALCNHLAIMVKGRFVCFGEVQKLKQKYGRGFTVRLQVSSDDERKDQVAAARNAFEETFPGTELKDEHQGTISYRSTDANMTWRVLFSKMEAMKAEHDVIEDYTITETSLEEVFLSFAAVPKK